MTTPKTPPVVPVSYLKDFNTAQLITLLKVIARVLCDREEAARKERG
ncbi:MAG TPA: hypothetical protein VIJ79_04425 [Acidobacteriaceae bacterium]